LVPVQTYFAEVFHNGYKGNYFEQYILFFTKPTDLTGYHGGFTPAHLWFILYLFVISLIALPVMNMYQKSTKRLQAQKIPFPAIMLLFFIPGFSQVILDIDGKSVGEYLAFFFIGYFVISNDTVQEKIQRYRFVPLCLAVICVIVFLSYGDAISNNIILIEILYFTYAWSVILALLGFGKRHLNHRTRATAYLARASFPVYVIHQQWIVVTAYFAIMWIQSVPLQILTIIFASVILTYLTYEAFRRTAATRFMFGITK